MLARWSGQVTVIYMSYKGQRCLFYLHTTLHWIFRCLTKNDVFFRWNVLVMVYNITVSSMKTQHNKLANVNMINQMFSFLEWPHSTTCGSSLWQPRCSSAAAGKRSIASCYRKGWTKNSLKERISVPLHSNVGLTFLPTRVNFKFGALFSKRRSSRFYFCLVLKLRTETRNMTDLTVLVVTLYPLCFPRTATPLSTSQPRRTRRKLP